eukprot:455683-Amphidinium_carterae.1
MAITNQLAKLISIDKFLDTCRGVFVKTPCRMVRGKIVGVKYCLRIHNCELRVLLFIYGSFPYAATEGPSRPLH